MIKKPFLACACLAILFTSKLFAVQAGVEFDSDHRFAKGGDKAATASKSFICPSASGNAEDHCDFLHRGTDCQTDADIKFFDKNDSDPNQQANNTLFFGVCNVADPNYQVTPQGIGPQFLFYLKSVDSGNAGELTSCILLSNESSSSPTKAALLVFLDPAPTPSTPRVLGCAANSIALVNLQAGFNSSTGNITANVECKGYDGTVEGVRQATFAKSSLTFQPCPSQFSDNK